MKLYLVGAELFYADRQTDPCGRTDRHEANSCFSQFYEWA